METTVGQSNDDTAITPETTALLRHWFHSTRTRRPVRCKPVYTALTTLDDFLDVKTTKPLLELIPDPIIENDLCHEVEVTKPLILSKITQGNNVFQNIAAVQKVVVTYK